MIIMKRTITAVFVMVLALLGAVAMQAKEKQEVVQMKNGVKLRGKIVVYAPTDSIVIQEVDGSTHAIRWAEIKKITRENWQPQQSVSKTFTTGLGVQKGYRGFVDAEYYVSIDAMSKSRFGFTTSHGYQLLPYLYVGVGFGMQFITGMYDPQKQLTYGKKTFVPIPVFADVRLDLYKYKYSPFIDVRLGKMMGDKAFGLMFNPSVGCRIGLKGSFAINVGVGYSLQSTDLTPVAWTYTIGHRDKGSLDPNDPYRANNPYHSLSVRLGVEF